jgi:hypothetical protein
MTIEDSDEFVLVCPKCGSTDLISKPKAGRYCGNCDYGHYGKMPIPFLELMVSELETFRQDIKDSPLIKE